MNISTQEINSETQPTVLIIDDREKDRELVALKLQGKYKLSFAETYDIGLSRILSDSPSIVLLDITLDNGKSGLDILSFLKEDRFAPPIIMLTTDPNIDTVVECMRRGAFHYIHKPPHRKMLIELLESALVHSTSQRRTHALENYIGAKFPALVHADETMKTIVDTATDYAATGDPILITGDPGTGKELLARLIHDRSPRCDGPFVAVNCAVNYSELSQSDFFGHEAGAFTGATALRRGSFELASGGTLMLDEIGDCPVDLQRMILRAVQDNLIKRVGGQREIYTDVRIISATNADINAKRASGDLRGDFMSRISTFHLHIPPLQNRPRDICGITEAYLARRAKLSKSSPKKLSDRAKSFLLEHPLPENARTLEALLARAVIASDSEDLTVRDFVDDPLLTGTELLSYAKAKTKMITQWSKEYFRHLYKRTKGNRAMAADIAVMAPQNLQRLSKKYGVDPDEFKCKS